MPKSSSLPLNIFKCETTKAVKQAVSKILSINDRLPERKDSNILLKPNFNSDMIGLTGNTTDLRIIVAVVKFLKEQGYQNITIGDGPSSGFINAKIDVLQRLGIYNLAEKLGVKVLDLNNASSVEVNIGKKKVRIAKICFENHLFINLPKLKTHSEAALSACLKNMIGCVVGLDKQKIHDGLSENILFLAGKLRPDLHIVDALIGMEGTGPSRGVPKKINLIISGLDPLLIDVFCAKLIGFDRDDVPYLKGAEQNEMLSQEGLKQIDSLTFNSAYEFMKPQPAILFGIVNHPKYRKFFVKTRYSPILHKIFSSCIVSEPLYVTGIRQDMFIKRDARISGIYLDKNVCNECGICIEYCPMDINIPFKRDTTRCIKCLYCYFACPNDAIRIEGEMGYLSYQIEKYKKKMKKEIMHMRAQEMPFCLKS